MQVVTYLHKGFHDLVSESSLGASEMESAFDAAITQVRKCSRSGMKAVGGEPAFAYLEKLEAELELERTKALERGAVDREWFQSTVRWLVEWVPETELTLIAALGRIVRSTGK
jgi:hypothetical protein